MKTITIYIMLMKITTTIPVSTVIPLFLWLAMTTSAAVTTQQLYLSDPEPHPYWTVVTIVIHTQQTPEYHRLQHDQLDNMASQLTHHITNNELECHIQCRNYTNICHSLPKSPHQGVLLLPKMIKTFFTNSPVIPYDKTEGNPELQNFPMYFAIPTQHLNFGQKYKGFSKFIKGTNFRHVLIFFEFFNNFLAKIVRLLMSRRSFRHQD